MASIVGDVIGGDSPHGRANEKIARELIAWMKANRTGIAGLDAGAPMLPQLDKLTDTQLRAAFASLDPMAAGDDREASGGRTRSGARLAIGSAHVVAPNMFRAVPLAEPVASRAADRVRPPEALPVISA